MHSTLENCLLTIFFYYIKSIAKAKPIQVMLCIDICTCLVTKVLKRVLCQISCWSVWADRAGNMGDSVLSNWMIGCSGWFAGSGADDPTRSQGNKRDPAPRPFQGKLTGRYFWKCNFPFNPDVSLSVGALVGQSVDGQSVMISITVREVKVPSEYLLTCAEKHSWKQPLPVL